MLTFAACYYYEILHCRVAAQNVDALYHQSQADVVIVGGRKVVPILIIYCSMKYNQKNVELFQLRSCPVCGCSLLPHAIWCGNCGWIEGSGRVKQKIKCPYCGKPIEFYVPEPEESTFMEARVTCDTCKSEVKVPILPKIVIKPI